MPSSISQRGVSYSYNKVDLDGDGSPETLLRVSSPFCGSGGCQISILKVDGKKYLAIDESLSFGKYIIIGKLGKNPVFQDGFVGADTSQAVCALN